MFFVDKWIHSISLINVQPEEKRASSYGNTIPRNCDVWFGMLRKTVESMNCFAASMWRFLCAKQWKNVQVLDAEKKLAWTGLDRVNFEKKSAMFKCSNQKIGVDRSRESQKGLFSGKCLKCFSSRLVTWGSPKRSALRWPDLDKRCSRCYTLRGCVLADVQSREELKMLLQAKRQPG